MRNSRKRSLNQIAEWLRNGDGVRPVKLFLYVALLAAAAVAQNFYQLQDRHVLRAEAAVPLSLMRSTRGRPGR